MPEPTDTLRERLVAATGLPALLDDARATWVARAERDAAEGSDDTVDDAAVVAASAVQDSDSTPDREVRGANESRRPTARWRAFEDAFPTFYQFTNRPRN
jgi:hypothetical protein